MLGPNIPQDTLNLGEYLIVCKVSPCDYAAGTGSHTSATTLTQCGDDFRNFPVFVEYDGVIGAHRITYTTTRTIIDNFFIQHVLLFVTPPGKCPTRASRLRRPAAGTAQRRRNAPRRGQHRGGGRSPGAHHRRRSRPPAKRRGAAYPAQSGDSRAVQLGEAAPGAAPRSCECSATVR